MDQDIHVGRLAMADLADRPCSPEELRDIITFPSGGLTMLPSRGHDEVHPCILLAEEDAVRDLDLLRRLKVTHVLNAAQGKNQFQVDLDPALYHKRRIKFMGIDAMDYPNFQLAPFFQQAAEFIEEAVLKKGKVMVNCRQGVSRSATLVLAYLMLKEHITAQDAVRNVRAQREICPNDGFLQQICDLHEKLQSAGHFRHKDDGCLTEKSN